MSAPASKPIRLPVLLFPAAVVLLALGLGLTLPGSSAGLSVSIESTPPGAAIFVNGRLAGSTPLRVEGLESGAYDLHLEKAGFESLHQNLRVPGPAELQLALKEWPSGKITVRVEPPGSEVLLDGQSEGHTPVVLEKVPAGRHLLEVRKTNYETFSQRIELLPSGTLAFEGFALHDKILAMYEGLVKSEPWRVNHLTELGHYLFVNGHENEAADVFGKALELTFYAPDLPAGMNETEKNLERGWRYEDMSRFNQELQKTRNWEARDLAVYRERLAKVLRDTEDRTVNDWQRFRSAVQARCQTHEYDRVEELFKSFLNGPQKEHYAEALVELLDARLQQRNLSAAQECAQRLIHDYPKAWDQQREAASRILPTVQAQSFPSPKEAQDWSQVGVGLLQAAMAAAPNADSKKACEKILAEFEKKK